MLIISTRNNSLSVFASDNTEFPSTLYPDNLCRSASALASALDDAHQYDRNQSADPGRVSCSSSIDFPHDDGTTMVTPETLDRIVNRALALHQNPGELADRLQAERAMFGTTVDNIHDFVRNSVTSPSMLVMGILSDAQEIVHRNPTDPGRETARQYINKAKFIVSEYLHEH